MKKCWKALLSITVFIFLIGFTVSAAASVAAMTGANTPLRATADVSGGSTESGSTEAEDAESGSTGSEDTESGSTGSEDTGAGNTGTGSTEAEDTESDSMGSGDTESGSTESVGTDTGDTESGSTESVGTDTGDTESDSTESAGTGTGDTESDSTESGDDGSEAAETVASDAETEETVASEDAAALIVQDGVEVYFEALSDAFGAVQEGETIVLCRNLTFDEVLTNDSENAFLLDFNGYYITFAGDGYFENNGHILTLYDSTWDLSADVTWGGVRRTEAGGESDSLLGGSGCIDRIVSGRYETVTACLISVSGDLSVEGGYFYTSAAGGSLFRTSGSIVFSDGIMMAPWGYVVSGGAAVQVDGGSFVYGSGFMTEGTLVLSDGKELLSEELYYDSTLYEGYVPGDAAAVVVLGDTVRYYGSLSGAWAGAVALSLSNDSAYVTVSSYNNVYQHTVEDGTLSLSEGNIILTDCSLYRGAEYAGSLITVSGGGLVLSDVVLSGKSPDGTVAVQAESSLLTVEGGSVVLTGSEGVTTLTENDSAGAGGAVFAESGAYLVLENVLITGNSAALCGGGIYAGAGAQVYLSGNVTVSGNTGADNRTDNVYLPAGVVLFQTGALSSDSVVGISHAAQVVNGLTSPALIADSYREGMGEENTVVEAYVLDSEAESEEQLYQAVYQALSGYLRWESGEKLLPDAGIFHFEILCGILGILLELLFFSIPVRRRAGAFTAVSSGASLCLAAAFTGCLCHIGRGVRASEISGQLVVQVFSDESTEETSALYSLPEDGREYIGVISVEALNMELPVLASYSAANLKTVPCVYYGSVETDDLVIVGHNYVGQFGQLNGMEPGMAVSLWTADGEVSDYVVSGMEILESGQVEEMITGDWDLTLFTCTRTGNKRLAIRCERRSTAQ